jgi:glycerophosphoryl diester phosphodiesterase
MLILCHRGYHVSVPANTYEAFAQAVAIGADGIETDVRLSADGQLILFHDRVAPDGRAVEALTHKELSACVRYEVPLLEVAIQNWDRVLWNLEIKAPVAVEATVATVSRLHRPHGYLITSFWHPVVEQISQRLAVDCGLLVAHRPFEALVPPLGWWPDHRQLNTMVWDYETLDTSLLEQTAARGLRNFVYGAETASEHQHCRTLKIDGLITDRPEFLLRKQ